jgi:hypothetical protein
MADLIDTFTQAYPRLYHMASGGSGSLIKKHGLLSTAKLCELFDVEPELQRQLLREHRPVSVEIKSPKLGSAIVRDQKPMSVAGLKRSLTGLSPEEWLITLNEKVFLWPNRERLRRMMLAKVYADLTHDLIIVDSKALLDAYEAKIWLSAINSGCTTPYAHPRGKDTFLHLQDYPLLERRKKYGEQSMVAEVAVQTEISDISKYIVDVVTMKGSDLDKLVAQKKI